MALFLLETNEVSSRLCHFGFHKGIHNAQCLVDTESFLREKWRENTTRCDDEVLGTLQFGYFYPKPPKKSKGYKRGKA